MNQILHTITKEFQQSKIKEETNDVLSPTVNGNKNISGFNILIGALFANNRNLSGSFTTTRFAEENKFEIKNDAPKINFLEYNITGSMLFIAKDVQRFFPNFDPDDKQHVELLKNNFENGQINSFSTDIKEIVEKDFGKTYEINFEKNILNYRKVEAVPNEYVVGIEQKEKKTLSAEEHKLKTTLENNEYHNFDEAQQYFFFLLNTMGSANIQMLTQFELHQINTDINLFVRSNNNYVLSNELEISDIKLKKQSFQTQNK